jgi:hypothetical protein
MPAPPGIRRPARTDARLEGQYARMTQTLGRLGLPRRPAETPAEYEARVVPFLSALERSLGIPLAPPLVSELTRRLEAVRYGGRAAADDAGIEASFARWTRAASRARLKQFWRRLWRVQR